MYSLLAELIVAIHLLYIVLVLGGLLLIVAGTVLRWNWIRNPWFRCIHLAMILIVALEAAVNFECPLTTWENDLRTLAGEDPELGRSFTSRLMATVLHPDWASEEKLYIGSMVLAGVILATFLFAPPRFRRRAVAVAQPATVVGHARAHREASPGAVDAGDKPRHSSV
jgi:Protein of Unknown function (DUF2784)